MRVHRIRGAIFLCGLACWRSLWAPTFNLWSVIGAAMKESGGWSAPVARSPAANKGAATMVSHASERLDRVIDRAVSKHCKGELAEAEILYEEALELAKEISSEERPEVLAIECQLATVLAKQQKYSDAEPVLKQALVNQRRVCDDLHHPLYLSTKAKLAGAYHGQGKLRQAKAEYSEALAGLVAAHGPSHPSCIALKEKLDLVSKEKQTDGTGSKRATRSTRGKWQWKPKTNPFSL